MRIIDADKLKDDIDYYIKEAEWGEEANKHLEWCKEFIDSRPTIDAKPVIRGRWIKEDRGHVEPTAVCSECGDYTYWSGITPYCANCGAEMDLEAEQ